MLHNVSSDSCGSIAIKGSVIQSMTPEQLVGALIYKANSNLITLEARIWHLSSLDEYFAPKYVQEPRCPESEDLVN
jgi:hypothetical protein